MVELAHRCNNLDEDEVFLDALIRSTRAALATHDEEKLEALRNGLKHSLGPEAPDIDEQARFFRYVDEFSVAHLHVLKFLDNPAVAYAAVAQPPSTLGRLLERWRPEFADDVFWYELLANELASSRLIYRSLDLGTETDLKNPQTTALGHEFLQFISGDEAPA